MNIANTNNSNSIIAGITLYNPDINRLRENVNAIKRDVDFILFIDNASDNIIDIQDFANENSFYLIKNKENLGLSQAFNTMIKFAKKRQYENLLLLDQDSICCKNLLNVYKKYISKEFVCLVPLIIHRGNEVNEKKGMTKNIPETSIIDESINSGTLINLKVLPPDIFFDENLFIDWIDIDFFHQIKKRHLKVLRINTVSLLADVGCEKIHHFLKYTWISSGYSAFRLRKQAQDTVYFKRKNWDHPLLKGHLTFIRWRWLMILFFEKHKLKKIFALIVGTLRGYKFCKKLNLKSNG